MDEKCETLAFGTAIYISKQHRFGTDAMLLADFCNIHRRQSGCDLGTGCGIIPFYWHDNGHRGRSVALEFAEEACALARKSAIENKAAHIEILQGDLRTISLLQEFDVVSCNPPYFTGGARSKDVARAAARHEETCTTQDVCAAAARLLKIGGKLCICQRPERLVDVFFAMRSVGIEPKRMRLVKQRPESEKAWLVLVEGKKAAKPGLRVEKELVIEREEGGYSKELLKIYNKGATE